MADSFAHHGAPVSFTKTKLDYPIFAAEFDPYNRGYLVVGGGGGAGRSGVPNKITVLDCSKRSSLEVAAEANLSRDEDSVTSVANLASRDGLITLAGINSSVEDQKAGKNEHLRAFDVKYPPRKRAQQADEPKAEEKEGTSSEGSISLAGKSSLFAPDLGPETYQRVLRLSPARKRESASKRIGAIATGLANKSEIVVFDATKTPITKSEIITTMPLPRGQEANDVDIYDSGENEFSIVYCTDYDIFEQTITYDFQSRKAQFLPKNPRRIHSILLPDTSENKVRPKYRALRFLNNNQNVLMLSNLPGKTGADLSILHLYPTGPALVHFHKVLPSHIKQAMSMDVCALDGDRDGSKQIAIAVAGQDQSIEVYALNYSRPTDTFSSLKSFTTLREVHAVGITAVRWEPFHSPLRAPPPSTETGANGQPASSPSKPSSHPQPQYIRLASTSMGNTVVRDSRYVLLHPSDENYSRYLNIALISFLVLVSAIVTQSYFFPQQTTAMRNFLPPGARDFLARPANVAQGMGKELGSSASSLASSASGAVPAVPSTAMRLRDLLHLHRSSGNVVDTKAVVLRSDAGETGLSVDVHPDREAYLKQDTAARHWHQLEEHEKQTWRERLVKAGEWTYEEGRRY
ncbi:hypothetical protein H2203_002475 [Taxawa tesnikishii (nom. ined.)]|nr:hypothetical protein H2203_002475 [Dothideales sp. JES 119]